MGSVIAVIELAAGRVAYFDPVSRIHLTLGRKKAEIYSYMNTTELKKAVKNGALKIYSGSLEVEPVEPEYVAPAVKKETVKESKKEVTKEKPVEEVKAEVIKEEVTEKVEEVVEEDKKDTKKKATKKKTSK